MAANNPAITDEVKAFIIQALASFDTPSQVVEAVKAEYGIVVTAQNVQNYDPTKYAGRKLAEKWRIVFEKSRKAFVDDCTGIPIAHRSTRLRALQRMATKAESMKNYPLAAQLHKQAAEEMGNAYTNRRELTGKDGKDLPSAAPAVAVFALPDNGRG
jgi:hypothetical protein